MATWANCLKLSAKAKACPLQSTQHLTYITNRLSCLRLSSNLAIKSCVNKLFLNATTASSFHTSTTHKFSRTLPVQDLTEFFDRKDVWGETSVTSGRPYRLDELRIKSNQDLHKLWYVLLKERNMLLTMEAEYNRNCELFPSPERITKVEESMENILEVVKERDNAVSLLETGKPSGPGGAYVRDFLGRVVWRNFQEYGVPPHVNKVYRLLYPRGFKPLHMKYLPFWREKIARYGWYQYKLKLKENKKLVEKFPHLEGKLHVPLPEEPKIN